MKDNEPKHVDDRHLAMNATKCPRCSACSWTGFPLELTETGAHACYLVCMHCKEKIRIKWIQDKASVTWICERWSMGKTANGRFKMMKWVHGEPIGAREFHSQVARVPLPSDSEHHGNQGVAPEDPAASGGF
jgi:hypothetical protein